MDFKQLQQLISRGIANAEMGEEPDIEIDHAAGLMPARSVRTKSPSMRYRDGQPPKPVEHREASRQRFTPPTCSKNSPPADDSPPVSQPLPGRRAMSEIRAAAERRAFGRNNVDTNPAFSTGASGSRSSIEHARGRSRCESGVDSERESARGSASHGEAHSRQQLLGGDCEIE